MSVMQIKEIGSTVTNVLVITDIHAPAGYGHLAHSQTDAICVYNINYLLIKQLNLDTVKGRGINFICYVNTPIIKFN